LRSSELEKKSQFVKIHRRRITALKYNFDVKGSQQGTGIDLNANVIMEKLYTFRGSRAAGKISYEEKKNGFFVVLSFLDKIFALVPSSQNW